MTPFPSLDTKPVQRWGFCLVLGWGFFQMEVVVGCRCCFLTPDAGSTGWLNQVLALTAVIQHKGSRSVCWSSGVTVVLGCSSDASVVFLTRLQASVWPVVCSPYSLYCTSKESVFSLGTDLEGNANGWCKGFREPSLGVLDWSSPNAPNVFESSSIKGRVWGRTGWLSRSAGTSDCVISQNCLFVVIYWVRPCSWNRPDTAVTCILCCNSCGEQTQNVIGPNPFTQSYHTEYSPFWRWRWPMVSGM